jgi:hypothetical protein
MKNSNDIIGYRTRDCPTCSVAPQPNALPRAPKCQADLQITIGQLISRFLEMYCSLIILAFYAVNE